MRGVRIITDTKLRERVLQSAIYKLNFPDYYTVDQMRSDAWIAKGFLEYLLTPEVVAEVHDLRLEASQTIEDNEQAFLNRLRLAGWTQQEAQEEWKRIQNDTESEP